MNWDALGAIGEILGASAVVLSLVYLAIQVRHAREATMDQNRLTRSAAVREIALASCTNDELRTGQVKQWGLEAYYENLAEKLGTTSVEASRREWADAYHFWMYWGQWSAANDPGDLEELKNVIKTLFVHGMLRTWDSSPLGKPLMDERFVRFVDGVLAE